MTVEEARALATRAHGDQRDRDGGRHIDHVARVARRCSGSEALERVAWLHDVLEDTDADARDLAQRLGPVEWAALRLLTHDDGGPYEAYVERIAGADGEAGALARAVKEADALDNLERCRTARDPAIERYGGVLSRLWRAR